MRMSAQKRVQASRKEPAGEHMQVTVLELEKAWRRWAQALVSVRRYPPVARRADSRLQLPEVSKVTSGWYHVKTRENTTFFPIFASSSSEQSRP